MPEDEVNFIGEIEAFAPDSEASNVFDLGPGTYVLLRNLVEVEPNGERATSYRAWPRRLR